MANSTACSSISAITQRLNRQSLLTPTTGFDDSSETVPVPPPRRSTSQTDTPKSKPRTKFQRSHKEFGDASAGCQDRPIPDENAGPAPSPRVSLANKSLPPRPTQSSGMPRLSFRACQALPSTPNGPGLADLPTGGATARRELSNSACEPRAGPGSPPLAPPVKRFCRSLTDEGLPRPKPLRPAATNTAEPLARSEDHMRSLIAARRLRRTAVSEDTTLPPPSSFVPYPHGGLRVSSASSRLSLDVAASFPSSTLSSGYGSYTASMLETTLGAVEPELAEIEAHAGVGSNGGGDRPRAPSPDSRNPAFEPRPPPLRSNPAVMKEKFEDDKVYRLVGGKYVHDRSKSGDDFFPKGAICLLSDLAGRPKSPVSVPAVWVPCVREDSEGEEKEEEEEELTLIEESRRGSRGDFGDLDLDSMEKDDSWSL